MAAKFRITLRNKLFRKYLRKLAEGIRDKDEHKTKEVKEYLAKKDINISLVEEGRSIQLVKLDCMPLRFSMEEILSWKTSSYK